MADGRRLLAGAGIVGPALFVAMWAILGATRAGYSPVDDAISRLAEVGSTTRPLMTIGFVGYGVLVLAYAGHPGLPRVSRLLIALTGLATLGVAAFPLGGTSDTVHAVFAAVGYATLAGAALTGAGKRAPRAWAHWSIAAGSVCALCLAASALGPVHGLFQRAGLTVGDAWLVASACRGWARGSTPAGR